MEEDSNAPLDMDIHDKPDDEQTFLTKKEVVSTRSRYTDQQLGGFPGVM